jgi:hypothetical protein
MVESDMTCGPLLRTWKKLQEQVKRIESFSESQYFQHRRLAQVKARIKCIERAQRIINTVEEDEGEKDE